MTADRLLWVDILKLTGLFFVILGHIASPFSGFIYSWHMPFFFFLSGLFMKKLTNMTELKCRIIKDFKNLMIPFYVFSLLALLAESIKRTLLNRRGLDYFYEIRGVLYDMSIESLSNHYGFVLWFLSALFFAKIIVNLLMYICKDALYFFPALSILIFTLSFNVDLPFSIDIALNAAFWVSLGILYKRWINYFSVNFILFFSVLLIVFIFYFWGVPALDMARLNYSHPLVNVVWALSVIVFLVCLGRLLSGYFEDKRCFIDFISPYFLFIFAFHTYTNNIGYLLAMKIADGFWLVHLLLSLVFIAFFVFIRSKFGTNGFLKYV
ncbi:acyltransferase family protein [Endozoicomonas sp.]|uniref:acyltransferase family protein n=1 Tax=Endozoicomonas sp. TaxID=1892382 RepID=UPI003AF6BF0B